MANPASDYYYSQVPRPRRRSIPKKEPPFSERVMKEIDISSYGVRPVDIAGVRFFSADGEIPLYRTIGEAFNTRGLTLVLHNGNFFVEPWG